MNWEVAAARRRAVVDSSCLKFCLIAANPATAM
jgi:hypothetical protein